MSTTASPGQPHSGQSLNGQTLNGQTFDNQSLDGQTLPAPTRVGPGLSDKGSAAVAHVVALARDDNSTLAEGIAVEGRGDEHFLPVTRYALVDRLTAPNTWPPGVAQEARRFFRYLDYWRQQRHAVALMHLGESYEAFSPDSDLFVTRRYTAAERKKMLADVVSGVSQLVSAANYTLVPRAKIAETILSKDSHYGLDLKVDFEAFEELVVAYRGESVTRAKRRKISRFFRREEFEVPIYRRMILMFKLKTPEQQVEDVIRTTNVSRSAAEKLVRNSRDHIPDQIAAGNVYIKIFKNIPKSDVEMVFPNTEVKFRMQDKLWLGVTGGGALGAGVFGAAGKLALAFSNPITAAGAVGGIGMVLFRQVMNVMNQKQRYMQVLAQNLYFHSMADNRGAITKLADRAAEEDFKEEVLLYSVLAKERVNRAELAEVDDAIQAYIERTFGLQVNFEIADALERLLADGVVSEDDAGNLTALPPREAADHIDRLWDRILDQLPADHHTIGSELERPSNGPSNGKTSGI